jgi:hypothetical protein
VDLRSARHSILASLAAGMVALAAAGCGGEKSVPPQASTGPVQPAPCVGLPEGVAQDGVNDDQSGSVPGVDPCDGPGN